MNDERGTMKAILLGNTSLTALIRCACGYVRALPLPPWSKFGAVKCNNCGFFIVAFSLEVISNSRGEIILPDLDRSAFASSPERNKILDHLLSAQRETEAAAAALRKLGEPARVHKILNIATLASAQRHLLAQDWTLADRA
jgi:hypothetical protein